MKNRNKTLSDNKKRKVLLAVHMPRRLVEMFFIFSVTFAFFLLISLLTYHANDPGWSSTGMGNQVANWGGKVGAWLADVLLTLTGLMSISAPILLVYASWLNLQDKPPSTKKWQERFLKLTGIFLFFAGSCGLLNFYLHYPLGLPAGTGGVIGDLLDTELSLLFNQAGTTLIFLSILLCGITLVTGLSWISLVDLLGERIFYYLLLIFERIKKIILVKQALSPISKKEPLIEKKEPIFEKTEVLSKPAEPLVQLPKVLPLVKQDPLREKKKVEIDPSLKLEPGTLPPLSLLNAPTLSSEKPFDNVTFEELSTLVEERLRDFGVEVKVVAVHPGPIITRFELELAPGIKVSKINGLAKDIARSLSTVSVRIVDVIPGKSVIGLEIPNQHRELVTLREMLESERYVQSKSPLSLVLGKDIGGSPVVVDLTKMPHLLVAGTTGSGKSVSLNAMLLSMLYKATPEHCRFILIDPKMLELSIYDGIPHLLTPVITDMKHAANALRWCVAEMDRRYRLMAALGVRNITGYNQKVSDAIKAGQPLAMPGILVTDSETAKAHLEPLPLIVVIADELADMMMVVGKKVEDLIARIAQKARASGIHLIIATQRPSVDVITGLIKANIPTRIAFQVSSRIDSRTILDQQGAEQLLGHGDMLYLPPGVGVPIRVHGAYVADEEVHRVVAAWRTYGQPEYIYEVTDEIAEGGETPEGERDPLYDEAVKIVTDSRRASISLVQRKLRIGYNRAARMMEEMEVAGIVSALDTSGTREVLVGGGE